jgi:hypothetical protein
MGPGVLAPWQGLQFSLVASIVDPRAGSGVCCSTLYRLPSAVGALPSGALLWAASYGGDPGPLLALRPRRALAALALGARGRLLRLWQWSSPRSARCGARLVPAVCV